MLIPVQPSPFDGWASAEMLDLLREARIYRPQLAARFVLNRCAARPRDRRARRRSRGARAMNGRPPKRGDFAARPGDAERWIKAREQASVRGNVVSGFTARLTIDGTPALRGRIKVAAFRRGVTVAEMLRELLIREFPDAPGGTP